MYVLATCSGANGQFASNGDWYYNAANDTCWMVSTTMETWDKAEEICMGMNAHLATVDYSTHDFLANILSQYTPLSQMFWIGLRLANPVTLQHNWVDSSFSQYRNWDRSTGPDPSGVLACVSMSNTNGKWTDDYCLRPKKYVCTVSKAPVAVPSPPPEDSTSWGCPNACTDCVAFRMYNL